MESIGHVSAARGRFATGKDGLQWLSGAHDLLSVENIALRI